MGHVHLQDSGHFRTRTLDTGIKDTGMGRGGTTITTHTPGGIVGQYGRVAGDRGHSTLRHSFFLSLLKPEGRLFPKGGVM
jgi:hypothetical protein